MGQPKEAKPAKLFMSIIAREDQVLKEGIDDLQSDFGKVDFVSSRFPFELTRYYTAEMGDPLFRHFVTFLDLISIPSLPQIKKTTNRFEEKYADTMGGRRLNIDPGYIRLEHVVLATTKGYSHRPYLGEGIYADLTLIYRNKSFQALEWTYPDYRQAEVIQLFNELRKRYSENLRQESVNLC